MTKLVFGVVDIPYVEGESEAKISRRVKANTKAKRSKVKTGTVTTGDVAQYLENEYGVMGHFWDKYRGKIASIAEKQMQGALENILLGAPPSANPLSGATDQIDQLFREFLDFRGMDGVVNGVPTKAAQEGINHRLKLKRGPSRPSFIDTGLYRASFKTEIKE